jgi:hypothetical protein
MLIYSQWFFSLWFTTKILYAPLPSMPDTGLAHLTLLDLVTKMK